MPCIQKRLKKLKIKRQNQKLLQPIKMNQVRRDYSSNPSEQDIRVQKQTNISSLNVKNKSLRPASDKFTQQAGGLQSHIKTSIVQKENSKNLETSPKLKIEKQHQLLSFDLKTNIIEKDISITLEASEQLKSERHNSELSSAIKMNHVEEEILANLESSQSLKTGIQHRKLRNRDKRQE